MPDEFRFVHLQSESREMESQMENELIGIPLICCNMAHTVWGYQ